MEKMQNIYQLLMVLSFITKVYWEKIITQGVREPAGI